jgi:hypothetical protein
VVQGGGGAVGVGLGLAWTPTGGELLFVEASLAPHGSGAVQLTGQLGAVMRESAALAVSWLKAHADALTAHLLPNDDVAGPFAGAAAAAAAGLSSEAHGRVGDGDGGGSSGGGGPAGSGSATNHSLRRPVGALGLRLGLGGWHGRDSRPGSCSSSSRSSRGAPPAWDLHIHVPAGATPKDGPSAGLCLAATLVSVLSGWPLDSRTAMTGEVTLRGRILPVGGVRDKASCGNFDDCVQTP